MNRASQFLHATEKQEIISPVANGKPQKVDLWINADFVSTIEFVGGCAYASTYDVCYLVDAVSDLEGLVTGHALTALDDAERENANKNKMEDHKHD